MRTLQAVAAGVMIASLTGVFYGAALESSSLMWPPMVLGLAGTAVLVLGVVGETWVLDRRARLSADVADGLKQQMSAIDSRVSELAAEVEAMQKSQAFQALR